MQNYQYQNRCAATQRNVPLCYISTMSAYTDLKDPSVSRFFRFLAKVGDGMMKMQIVKIGFGGRK